MAKFLANKDLMRSETSPDVCFLCINSSSWPFDIVSVGVDSIVSPLAMPSVSLKL